MKKPDTQSGGSLEPVGSPFSCDNCGHKPTPQEVIEHKGECAKCGDTIITYTIDAAEYMLRLMVLPPDVRSFVERVTMHLQANRSKKPEQHDAMFQEAYRLYCKYDVEGRANTPAHRPGATRKD